MINAYIKVGFFTEERTLYHLINPVTDQATDLDSPLTNVENLLLLLQSHTLSLKELRLSLGLKHRQTLKENYLNPALEQGLIEMTLPDKPTSPEQTYRLTKHGKTRVRTLLNDKSNL
ncbi:Uncharacterised protein [Oligella ureolytica]|uniref:Filamentation induced by cAMP protein Fic-like C-terminal domain-containing protein n=1 Tax=Oligella ureolytica TaxID=90244 RepID=A0A378XES9_9BURK|nr:Uncharacterised protein [Oligella ureolytica]